ncbi:hypothetical protein C2S51_007219 [Perilla frutescens var. frutescens]|nr:hypothetical protein C2S51_007219 [Perilla frutescens var. frutescens]
MKYQGYLIDGVTYYTRERDDLRAVQNSGVSLVAKTMQVASAKDKNPIVADMMFYGKIEEIWELDYNICKFVLFKCSWVENNSGVKVDDLGFTLVNLKKIGYKNDSFILGKLVKQVFYVDDPHDPSWSVILASPSKEYIEFINGDELGDIGIHHQCFTTRVPIMDLNDEHDEDEPPWVRGDCDDLGLTMDIKESDMGAKQSEESGVDSKSTQSTRSLRGKVYLNNLAQRKAKGIRQEVQFNKLGQPFGPFAAEMQSYIGLLARKEVKITYKTWKNVPTEVKELIWELVNLSYQVDERWKTGCLESANAKWRQWKTKLYNDFIVPHKDNPSKLNDPPPYSGILLEDWSRFKLSEVQKDRRMKNIYPHRLSRTGYADLAEKMKHELRGDADIDRALMWKKARVTKDGDIEDDNLKKAVERIDDYIRQKEDGVFKSQGMDGDLLTCALEKPEHSGRVRGVGGYVTPSMYFKVPRGGRRGVKLDDFELMEVKKEISASREMIKDLYEKIAELQTAMKKDRDNDEKSSCFVKWVKGYSKDEFLDEEVMLVEKQNALQGKIVSLKLDSSNGDIVAYGTVIAIEGVINTLIGCELPNNCTCVSIDEAVTPNALLPYPIPNVCDNVGDAVGSQVPWPAHLVEVKEKKHINKKIEAKQMVKKRLVKSYKSLNSSLKGLYCYAESAMKNGEGIFIPLDDDVFGNNCEIYIHLEDIIPFCDLDPISGNCMVAYIWHLFRKMREARTLGGFRFVNPFTISHMAKCSLSVRTQALGDRLNGVCLNQLVVVPCNIGLHWILTVIDPHKEVVYLLDPLGNRMRDDSWKNIVDR